MPSNLDHRIAAYQQASAQAYRESRYYRGLGAEWTAILFANIAAGESAKARSLLWQEA